MAYATGTRSTSGDGSAVASAGAAERLKLGEFIQLQLTVAGPVTVVLKLGSTTHYTVLLQNAGDGVILHRIPPIIGQLGEDLYVDLSDAKAVGYVIAYDVLTTY